MVKEAQGRGRKARGFKLCGVLARKKGKILFQAWEGLELKEEAKPVDLPALLKSLASKRGPVPVLCDAKLGKRFEGLKEAAPEGWRLVPCGPSSTVLYYIDIFEGRSRVLRVWDPLHLEPSGDGGLLPFLKGLLERSPWLEPSDFGASCLTKTSIVRLWRSRVVGATPFRSAKGKRQKSLWKAFFELCFQEDAKTYQTYALRKACFRAGLAFTGGTWAARPQERVVSLDVTSMHHASIAGRLMPRGFQPAKPAALQKALEETQSLSLEAVLGSWKRPFPIAFHARVRVKGLRLKKGSLFEREGIATLAKSKAELVRFGWEDGESSEASWNGLHAEGFTDRIIGGEWAFGKLIRAEEAELFLTEIEAWILRQVYDWNSIEAVSGEATSSWAEPPALVLACEQAAYGDKEKAKAAHRKDPSVMGDIIYQSNKARFNSLYGILVQDEHRPGLGEDGKVMKAVTPETFKPTEHPQTLFSFGSRIAAGSRLHLISSMLVLEKAFGSRLRFVGGDTDSFKISLPPELTPDEIMKPLERMGVVCQEAIESVLERTRALYPEWSHQMTGVGAWDLETPEPLAWACELYPKCRAACTQNGVVKATVAGLPLCPGKVCLSEALTQLAQTRGIDFVRDRVWAPGLVVSPELAHLATGGSFTIGDSESPRLRGNLAYWPELPDPRVIGFVEGEVIVVDDFTGEVL